jgi:hypothetical protein
VSLVRQVLAGVSDTRLLLDHKEGATPLRALIKAYDEKSSHNDNAPNLTPTSTGEDLKSGIEKLLPDEQVEVLNSYVAFGQVVPVKHHEHEKEEEAVEDRKLRMLAMKVAIYAVAVVFVMLVASVLTIAVKRGEINSEMINTFVEFAGEVVMRMFEK